MLVRNSIENLLPHRAYIGSRLICGADGSTPTPDRNVIYGTVNVSSGNFTISNAIYINRQAFDVYIKEDKSFELDLGSISIANFFDTNGDANDIFKQNSSQLHTYITTIDFRNASFDPYCEFSNMFCFSSLPYLTDVYFDFSNTDTSNFCCGGAIFRQLRSTASVHGFDTLRWSGPIVADSNSPTGWHAFAFREYSQQGVGGVLDLRGFDTTSLTDQNMSTITEWYKPTSYYGFWNNFTQSATYHTWIIGNLEIQKTLTATGLSNIRTVYCTSQTPPSLGRTGTYGAPACDYISQFNNLQNIYVPTGCLSVYQNAPVWSNYASLMSELDAPDPLSI